MNAGAAAVGRDGPAYPTNARAQGAGFSNGARLRRALLRAGGAVFRRTAGAQFDAARELADYRRRAEEAWPKIEIADVDSTGLPDTPLLGSQLTLTATVRLAGLRPNDVTVQGCWAGSTPAMC